LHWLVSLILPRVTRKYLNQDHQIICTLIAELSMAKGCQNNVGKGNLTILILQIFIL
jgi:hypothetical protein